MPNTYLDTVNSFGGKKTLANLANHSNLPSYFSLWSCNYVLSINARKASWFAVTYASTYAYMAQYGLLFMSIFSPIATSITILILESIH